MNLFKIIKKKKKQFCKGARKELGRSPISAISSTFTLIAAILVIAGTSWSYISILTTGDLPFGIPLTRNDDVTVTITPESVNCDGHNQLYTLKITNVATSKNDIREVQIYHRGMNVTESNVLESYCGPPPAGWTLFDFSSSGFCMYEASKDNMIHPRETNTFTFYAKLSDKMCGNEFLVRSLFDDQPVSKFIFSTARVLCSECL